MIFTSHLISLNISHSQFIILAIVKKTVKKKIVKVDVLIFYLYFLDLDKQHGLHRK